MIENKRQQITKNQHYVPQCLLKHFSQENRGIKRINIFDAKQSSFRKQAINKVFSANYFYDRDNSIENMLSEYIESPASPIIDSIVRNKTNIVRNIESVDWKNLLCFIAVLHGRTPQAIARDILLVDQLLMSVSKVFSELNNIDSSPIASLNIEAENRSEWAGNAVVRNYIASSLLSDLQIHIINNKTSRDFILSDHPVFVYNWFYKNLKHPAITAWQAKGLQIFLPLSPKIILCLYDENVYKYRIRNKYLTNIYDVTDVDILNSFQILSAESILGFYSEQDKTYISSMFDLYKQEIAYSHSYYKYQIRSSNSKEIISSHIPYVKQFQINRMPTFVNIRKQIKERANVYEIRSLKILIDYEHKMRRLENKRLN